MLRAGWDIRKKGQGGEPHKTNGRKKASGSDSNEEKSLFRLSSARSDGSSSPQKEDSKAKKKGKS